MPKPTDLYVARERKSVAEHDAVYGAARVTRHPDWPKRWRVWKDRGEWVVSSPEYAERGFPTWRMAMDYADRRARTREYVLPRVAPQGEVSVSATWYCDQGAIHYINSAGQVVQGAPADVKPLALVLLALAEQEEHE